MAKSQISRRNFLKSTAVAIPAILTGKLTAAESSLGTPSIIPDDPSKIKFKADPYVSTPQRYSAASPEEAIYNAFAQRHAQLPTHPIQYGRINHREGRFENMQSHEYQHPYLHLIDDLGKVQLLAESMAPVYNPKVVNSKAFDYLSQFGGATSEIAQELEGQIHGCNPYQLDQIAQFALAYNQQCSRGGYYFETTDRNDQRVFFGSRDMIASLKQGPTKHTFRNHKPLRSFGQALLQWITGQGFPTTGHDGYDRDDINLLSRRGNRVAIQSYIEAGLITPDQIVNRFSHFVPYGNALNLVEKYRDSLPEKDFLLWWPNAQNPTLFEHRLADPTSYLNPSMAAFQDLEHRMTSIPQDVQRVRLSLGEPDNHLVSSRARRNQLTTQSGLLAVDTYSNTPNNRFAVGVEEITGFSGLNETSRYKVCISFGEPRVRAEKKVRDRLGLVKTLERAAVGFAFAGPIGAVVLGPGVSIVEGTWGYFEGMRPPTRTILDDHRTFTTALQPHEANTFSVLDEIDRSNATDAVIFNYGRTAQVLNVCDTCQQNFSQDCGTAVVYGRDIKNPMLFDTDRDYCYDTLYFESCDIGVNHLRALLYGVAFWGTIGLLGKINGKDCPSHKAGGGRNSGPGGNSYGGGSHRGGAGGGSYNYGGGRY